ncbi:MAG: hypothetical protein Q8O20_05490 [Sulfuricurvum sp.]|uniref:hypothetical protein n=1 Tax=Sulfuricurvum sp. TaxID=2025608 RepID=UPI0027337141|nr:hypothetical protein [Sulfuricurvum sp.]MDP2850509.1 hypothetical protein [Sulfuricurvum sp.]
MIDYRGYEINIANEDSDEKATQLGNVDKVINLIKDGMDEEEACLKIDKTFRKDFRKWTGQSPLTASEPENTSQNINSMEFKAPSFPETLFTLKKEYKNFPDVLSAIAVLEAILKTTKDAKEQELKDVNDAKEQENNDAKEKELKDVNDAKEKENNDEKDANEIKTAMKKLSPEARKNLLAELSQLE